ncbi:MAG TPA: hypothetical protein VHA75_01060 [Rugosimonospora sp.]|nr:hypothetical protein [Rugosimonospora sp.]
MSTFEKDGSIDPSAGRIISCFGRKGSGKSVMALAHFRAYPYDRIVIDPSGDDGPVGEDVHELKGDVSALPARWPEMHRVDEQPMTLRYVPDMGSSTALEDMDAVVGLAMHHGRCALLVHEVGLIAPAGRTPPNMRRLLNANRHRQVTAIFCGPRPQTIDPLVLAQSDLVYTFDLANPNDRKRIAEEIGWNPREFDAGVHELAWHEYLLFDRNEDKPAPGQVDLRLLHYPPLPREDVDDILRWARGQRPHQLHAVR